MSDLDNKRPAPGEGAGLDSKCVDQAAASTNSVYRTGDSSSNTPAVQAVYCFSPFGSAIGPDVPAFCRTHADHDVYRLLGEPHEPSRKKPKKSDMLGSWRVWVELDPPATVWDKDAKRDVEPGSLDAWRAEALQRLRAYALPPTAIIDSGRGYWAEWDLDALGAPADIEAANRGLIAAFAPDADACHNIDRVARMWGTRNSKTGRMAALVEYHPDRVYSLSAFAAPVEVEASKPSATETDPEPCSATPVATADLAELQAQYKLRDEVCLVISRGKNPERPDQFPSRSEAVFYVCCELHRRGVPEGVILGILLDDGFAISDSIFVQRNGKRVPNPEAYARRQIANARAAVERDGASGAETGDFEFDDKRRPKASQHNIRVALGKLGARVRRDVFQDRLTITGLDDVGPLLDDRAIRRLWLLIDERYGFRPAKDFFWDVVQDLAARDSYHPVREYLDSLTWDGTPRIDSWLVAYGGAEDSAYVRAVGRLMLVAAVRRINVPGCKFDEMPVLEGAQGTNKSSALALLVGNEDWFTDDLPLNADSKRTIEALAGRWIVEAAELKGMRKGEVEHLKAFLSRQYDRARMSYDRTVTEVHRQCIVVGTTNSSQYLRDGTGNRRFWPVRIARFDLDALSRDRDQLWAEAATCEAAGEAIRLDPSLWSAAAAEQEKRAVEDPFLQTLAAAFGTRNGKVSANDVFAFLDIPSGQRHQEHNARVGEAMRALGFERRKLRFGGPPEWGYVRGEGQEREVRLAPSRNATGGVSCVEGEVPF